MGYYENAQKIWFRYFERKDIPPLRRADYALKIARSRVLTNNIQGALEIMGTAMKKDCMNLHSYNFYISLSVLNDEVSKGMELLDLVEKKYSSTELNLKKALISVYLGNFEQAEKTLNKLQTPVSSSISSLAVNYNARMYLALLRFMSGSKHSFFSDLQLNSKESSLFLNGNVGESKLMKLPVSPDLLEKEAAFYEALSQLVKNKRGAFELFKSKSSFFPDHPVIDFIVLKIGMLDESNISSFASTSLLLQTGKISFIEGGHGFFVLSPLCIAEISQVLYSLGAYEQADMFIQSSE